MLRTYPTKKVDVGRRRKLLVSNTRESRKRKIEHPMRVKNGEISTPKKLGIGPALKTSKFQAGKIQHPTCVEDVS